MQLKNRSAIITGASQGLGVEIAKCFIQDNINIMICARDNTLLKKVHKELEQLADGRVKVYSQSADVSKMSDVNRLVHTAVENFGDLDILVANAGVYGTKGPIEQIDWQEWSETIDINLKGTVLQCRAVVPIFKQKHAGKILILAGGGATKPMPYLSAYAASKAGLVRFAETLAEELKEFNIDVNAIAPGALNTRMLDEILLSSPDVVGKHFYEQALKQKKEGGTPLFKGAHLCAFLASEKSNGITGKLISAVWDEWESFPQNMATLKNTDVYTLRRIVPEDRQNIGG